MLRKRALLRGLPPLPLSFGHKLVISYLLIVLLPLLSVGTFAYQLTASASKEKLTTSMAGMLEQLRDNIRHKTEDVHRISDRIYFDYPLQEYLRNREEGWVPYETTTKVILPMLDNVLNYTNSRIWVTLYLRNETFPEIYSVLEPSADPLAYAKGYDLYHLERIENEPWKEEAARGGSGTGGMIWRQVAQDADYGNISLLRRLDDVERQQEIGLIRVTIKLEELFEAVDNVQGEQYERYGMFSVIDEQGRLLYASADEAGGSEDTFMLTQPIPGTRWRMEAVIPQAVLREEAKRIRNLTLLVCGISAGVLAVVGAAVSRYFSRRVHAIVTTLQAFQEGEFHRRVSLGGSDEFSEIAAALNQLGRSAHELIEQVYVANLHKKEAELAFLQAQINPHFLYNTLSSISRLAKLGELEKLHSMVLGLAKFYRLTLNEGRMIIAIAKELEQVQAYIDIQKMKYGNRLETVYEFDPQAGKYDTVKMILQPFVENVLEHAWRGDRIRIRIVVLVKASRIVFRIIDDGIGMRPDTIKEIFADSEVRRGYGIRNVDERIKLQYGERHGVRIRSKPGKGTAVQLTIPKNVNGYAAAGSGEGE